MVRRRAFVWIFVGGFFWLGVHSFALAVPPMRGDSWPIGPPSSPRPSSSSTFPARSTPVRQVAALARISSDLSDALHGACPPGTRVVVAGFRSDEPAPRGGELSARLGALIGGAREARAPHLESRASAKGAGADVIGPVVALRIEVARGTLTVRADVTSSAFNVWEQAKARSAPPLAHASASAPIDAEVRSYLGAIPLVALRAETTSLDDRDVVAVACGDLDGDGTEEIATVGRRRIAIGRVKGQRFVVDRFKAWSDLSAVAPAPLREPLAAASIISDASRTPRLDVSVTDRARAVRLDALLQPVLPLTEWPTGEPGGPSHDASLGKDIDALAMARIVTADGTTRTIRAARTSTGDLALSTGASTATWPNAGAQVVIADLDEDGDPEIVTSLDVLAPAADALVVLSWKPGTPPRERTRLAVPTGVRAIAVCPPDRPGPPAIIVATASAELWVIR